MRIRFKMLSDEIFRAECDLTKKQAQSLYNRLEKNMMCLWAELVCEDESEGFDYMDVIKSFNNDYKTAEMLKEIGVKEIV